MCDIGVLQAFLDGKPAETGELRSDGRKLYAGPILVADRRGEHVRLHVHPATAHPRALLRELLDWKEQRDRLIRRLTSMAPAVISPVPDFHAAPGAWMGEAADTPSELTPLAEAMK